MEGHQGWAVCVSPKRVHSLRGLRQDTRGRLWSWLSRPRGSSRIPPPPGVLFHPPSVDAPPGQVNLANVIVHGRIIEQIQDQEGKHEEAVDPHSKQCCVVAGEGEAETEPHSQQHQHSTQVDRHYRHSGVHPPPTLPTPRLPQTRHLPCLSPVSTALPLPCALG